MPKKKDFAQNLIDICSHVKNVAICGHITPDYDSLCSSFALQEILRQNGIKSDVLLESELDENFYDFIRQMKVTTTAQDYEAFICVDCREKNMLPKIGLASLNKAKSTFVIDHHMGQNPWAEFNQIFVGESSACEVVFRTFEPYFKLNKKLAKIFYIGMYADTGGFIYSNVHPTTFEILAKLVKYDIKIDEIVRDCFEVVKRKAFEINKRAINSVKFYHDGDIAVSIVNYKDYQETGALYSGGKFIVSYLQNVEGVKVSINVFEREPKVFRVSLRTAVDGVDVNKIATHFKGGGHKRASGLTLMGDLNKCVTAVIKQAEYELENDK